MVIGLIGLGKMGLPLALNMADQGFQVLAIDAQAEVRAQAHREGVAVYGAIPELLAAMPGPRVLWLMVPAGEIVDQVLQQLTPLLLPGDVLIDGGNSHYKDTRRRAMALQEAGLVYMDCGTSGGVSGARNGICAMVGGDAAVFKALEPLFQALSVPNGYTYCGPSGSGHYTKMVHNAIEYGMMQAIGEGMELLKDGPYELPLPQIAKVWNHGSVIRSWLMELAAEALEEDPALDQLRGVVHSSGEGRWAVETALEYQIPLPAIAQSMMMRFRSKQEDTFAGKMLAALRNKFGGHQVEKA